MEISESTFIYNQGVQKGKELPPNKEEICKVLDLLRYWNKVNEGMSFPDYALKYWNTPMKESSKEPLSIWQKIKVLWHRAMMI